MKKLLALSLATIVLTNSQARADVLIYKLTGSETRTGNGAVQKYSYGGFLVIEPNAGRITAVRSIPAKKIFTTEESINYDTRQIAGPTFTNTVLSFPGNGLGAITMKGKNFVLTTGASLYTAPKAMTYAGSDLGESILSEMKGAVVFDQKTTLLQNAVSGNFDNAVQYLAGLLTAKGYVKQ